MPKAKDFKKWVTKEVLPEIRKTGRYEVNQDAINPQLSRPADEIKVILPCSGLYLVSAKENGPHIVEPAADDKLEPLCVHLSFDHLCYAVKSIKALWTQLRLRLPALDEKPNAARINFLDEAINNASRISSTYKSDY